jgi:hypothetical protein
VKRTGMPTKQRVSGLTARERKVLALAKSRGAPVSTALRTSKFTLIVSPITTHGIDVSVLLELGEGANRIIHSASAAFELTGIVLFPIIADPGVHMRADFQTHKRASRGYFIGRNIDFDVWRRARRPRRLELAAKAFTESVLAVPERDLSPASKECIVNAIGAAAARLSKAA